MATVALLLYLLMFLHSALVNCLTDPTLPGILLPFGTDVGDRIVPVGDDAYSPAISIPSGFLFFNVRRNTVYVSLPRTFSQYFNVFYVYKTHSLTGLFLKYVARFQSTYVNVLLFRPTDDDHNAIRHADCFVFVTLMKTAYLLTYLVTCLLIFQNNNAYSLILVAELIIKQLALDWSMDSYGHQTWNIISLGSPPHRGG